MKAGYAPKGGMCVKCAHSKRKCDHLEFHNMKVIERCKVSLVKIVKCSEFERKL